ncbi:MAG TPA: class I adenylate-forming enzyme family protein [Actinophytocola sp.]|uniref:class I adenylate-forming enzyme family protein n=1 Tax=Actinophytocola sp. TaxID=1872138 RepID=UPI002DB7871D|nr:class I adenylate-forming enzyme family protein [Actinophytocola sp.]HEU5469111.1 class I adenylate-forming enzyme family protein [Actinophytocola sp.]
MRPRSMRAALLADENVGGGNVVASLLAGGADPDGPGLSFDTDVDGIAAERMITLGRLDERINARTDWLHRHGIRHRDPVAVWTTDAADVVLSFLALTRIGAIPALMNGKIPPDIAAEYIRRLRTVGVLADAPHAELLAGQDIGVPVLGAPAELGTGDPAGAPPHYRHHPDDPVVITHSSGTTGVPKAVMHTHATIYAATRHLLSMPQAQGTNRILNALPIPHTATVIMANQALGNRAEFLSLSKQDGPYVLDAIERWRPAAVFGFAVTWSGLARFDLTEHDLGSVRLWFNTGDSAHEAHIRRLVAAGARERVTREGVVTVPGSVFIDGLGSSEMGHSMFHIHHSPETERYGRCIGKPYEFVEAVVLDRDGMAVPDGQVGLLGLRSPSLSPGYWNDSVTTHRFRRNGWSMYGDLVYRDADGWFYHMDRVTDAAELGDGRWIFTALSEERVLAALPEVVDCTAVVVSHDDTVITDVLLELHPDADPTVDRTERVRAAIGEPAGSTLNRVTVVSTEEIPLTVTGKVRKFLLRQRHLTGVS